LKDAPRWLLSFIHLCDILGHCLRLGYKRIAATSMQQQQLPFSADAFIDPVLSYLNFSSPINYTTHTHPSGPFDFRPRRRQKILLLHQRLFILYIYKHLHVKSEKKIHFCVLRVKEFFFPLAAMRACFPSGMA